MMESTETRQLSIAIACGGTGGHIFPGLATGEVLKAQGHKVTLWLAGKDVENVALEEWDGPVHTITAQGLPSKVSMRSLKPLWGLTRAVWRARRIMKYDRPDVMLAMGSYASIAPVLAASILRIPIVLHEANVIPGRAITFLSPRAATVALGFGKTTDYLNHPHTVVTGMPLRKKVEERLTTYYPEELDRQLFTFLVTGGSRGAHRLNVEVSEALCNMAETGIAFQVIHLTGAPDERYIREQYNKHAVRALVVSFHHNMPNLYAMADFAICRAGAATCAELAISGMPALFIPHPFAGNHQLKNAQSMADAGMADVCEEQNLSVEWLVQYLSETMAHTEKIATMSVAAKGCAHHHAAEQLAKEVANAARHE